MIFSLKNNSWYSRKFECYHNSPEKSIDRKGDPLVNYHIFDFHKHCLIDMDIIQQFKYVIDCDKKVFRNSQTQSPLHFKELNLQFNFITVPPDYEKIMQFPVETQLRGDVLIPHIRIAKGNTYMHTYIPEGLTTVVKIICSVMINCAPSNRCSV